MELETDIAKVFHQFIDGICEDKDDLRFTEHTDGAKVEITVQASLNDHRLLVGKGGRTVTAMKRLVDYMGKCSGILAHYELENPNSEEISKREKPFVYNQHFDEGQFACLLGKLCKLVNLPSPGLGVTPARKIAIIIPPRNSIERSVVNDVHEMVFVYCRTLGREIEVNPKQK